MPGQTRQRRLPGQPRLDGNQCRRRVKVARVSYAGNWDPEPLAWTRYSNWLQRKTGTRLAPEPTAAAALKQTFGCDGQPGSYEDIDVTDCLLHVGHNMAHTDTVLWMRVLDRRRGANPPKMVVIDPRRTPTAKEADVHLMLRVGTNAAVLNGLNNLLIQGGYADEAFIAAHTIGFEDFKERVSRLSGACRRPTCAAPLTSSADRRACCRVAFRASTSPTRAAPRRCRSTTSTCCSAGSAAPAAASCR